MNADGWEGEEDMVHNGVMGRRRSRGMNKQKH